MTPAPGTPRSRDLAQTHHPVRGPVVVALLAVLLLAGMGWIAEQHADSTVREQAVSRVRSSADAATRALVRESEDLTRTTASWAANPSVVAALTSPDPAARAEVQADLGTLAATHDAPAVFVSDLRARPVAIYPAQPELIGRDFSFRDWFKGVAASGAPYVSVAYRSAASGHPLVVGVAAPVRAGTKRVGYLTVLWQLDSVRGVAEGTLRDDGTTISVTDQRGQSLTDALAVDDRGQPASAPVSDLVKQALAGRSVSTVRDDRLVSVRPVPGLGWTVEASVARSVALAPAAAFRRSMLETLGLGLLLVVGFTVVAVRVSRQRVAAAEEMQALDRAFAERGAFLATLVDTMEVSVLACDAAGRPTLVNHQVRAMHHLGDNEVIDDLSQLRVMGLDGTPLPTSEYPLVRALEEGEVRDAEILVQPRGDGPPVRLVAHARRLSDADGRTLGAVVAAHDVTALRASEASLQRSEERFRRVFDEGLTGKLLVDPAGVVVRVNAQLARLVGRAADELVGRHLVSLLDDPADRSRVAEQVAAGEGQLQAEMRLRAADGRRPWGLVAMVWMTEHDGRRLLLVQVQDVTARRAAEERLTELALHDELTGLPNRRLLLERCEHAFDTARSGRRGSSVAALFIDLDGFKAVNDLAGHEAGDRLLVDIARDLQSTLRPTDTVARVGGDEFVVLVEQDDGLAYLRTVADRIATTVRRQVTVDDTALPVSASIGIARVDLAHEPDVGPEQLLRRADAAMYRAKGQGPDRHDVFDVDLRDRIESRRELEHEVREALSADRVDLVFQPVVDVDSGVVLGAEALVRLRTATGRVLPTLPAVVAAEGAGLAERLGDRVLHLALQAAATWPGHMTVAVNISARELTGRDLRMRVEQALARNDVDPSRLVLEVTESAALNTGHSALAELERLRARGVRVAIDDFGTAYANLQNLTTLPVDVLKVDASFTAGLPDQRAHSAVVHGIASMAFELDIPCVVEGVETARQLDALRGMSVHAQGWLWGQPFSAGQVPVARVSPDR